MYNKRINYSTSYYYSGTTLLYKNYTKDFQPCKRVTESIDNRIDDCVCAPLLYKILLFQLMLMLIAGIVKLIKQPSTTVVNGAPTQVY